MQNQTFSPFTLKMGPNWAYRRHARRSCQLRNNRRVIGLMSVTDDRDQAVLSSRPSRSCVLWAAWSVLKQVAAPTSNFDAICFGVTGIAFRTAHPIGGHSCIEICEHA